MTGPQFGVVSLWSRLQAVVPEPRHTRDGEWFWTDITPDNAHLLVDYLADVEMAGVGDLTAAADRATLRGLVGPK